MRLRTTLHLASFFPIFLTALFVLHLLTLHASLAASGHGSDGRAVAGAIAMAIFSLLVGWSFYRAGQKVVSQVGTLEDLATRAKQGDLVPGAEGSKGRSDVAETTEIFSRMVVELHGYADLIRSHEKLREDHEAALATAEKLRESAVQVAGEQEGLRRAEFGSISRLLTPEAFILSWLPVPIQRSALGLDEGGHGMDTVPERIRRMFRRLADRRTTTGEPEGANAAGRELVSARGAIEDAIALCCWKWENERGVDDSISVDLDESTDAPPDIRADWGDLVQAFSAVLLNAADAMPNGGTIRAVISTDAGGSVNVAITDDGEGMLESVQNRCMTPFFSTREGRLGLGLALASRLIVSNGGRLGLISTEAGGTAAHVSFSRKLRAAPEQAPRQARRSLAILAVDDDAAVRKILVRTLVAEQHRVSEAEDGAAAVLALRRQQFDLVVTDRAMPIMNGEELAAVVKRRQPGCAVILATPAAEELMHRERLPDGVDALLPKPVLRDGLRIAIDQALEHQQITGERCEETGSGDAAAEPAAPETA